MVAKSSTFNNDLLKLIFQGTAIADIAENDTSSPLTSLYLALHTATPAVGGDQTTNECAYTSYARKAVTRNSGGFTVSGSSVTLAADNSFVAATGGTETATFFSVGTASSGTGKVLYFGPVTPNIAISNGVTPILTTATTITEG